MILQKWAKESEMKQSKENLLNDFLEAKKEVDNAKERFLGPVFGALIV